MKKQQTKWEWLSSNEEMLKKVLHTRKLLSEIDISKYTQREYIKIVNAIYMGVFDDTSRN